MPRTSIPNHFNAEKRFQQQQFYTIGHYLAQISHVGVWEFKIDVPHSGSVIAGLKPSHGQNQTT